MAQESTFPGASHRSRRRILLSFLKRVYRPGDRILDVGCGSGILLEDIARLFSDHGELYGTDISEQALKIAFTRTFLALHSSVRSSCEDIAGHGLLIYISSETLEHVPNT